MANSADHDAGLALAMIQLVNSLGLRVPWANLRAAWPSDATSLQHAVDDLFAEGLIQATPTGLVVLGAPPSQRIAPAETDRAAR